MPSSSDLPALELLADPLAVCRLPVDAAVPNWAWFGELTSVTSSDDELSLVCAADAVPVEVEHTPGWRALKVQGPLDFALVGILAGIATVLAEAGVSIFAISTHDTDYILVQESQLESAATALGEAGYEIAAQS